MINHSVLSDPNSNTLIHEIGHWLGLYHVFQAPSAIFSNKTGCDGAGDYVNDTPAQKDADGYFNLSCNKNDKYDSCPIQKGYDPIENFMNYTDNKCRKKFTVGQIRRMINLWNAYRAPLPTKKEPVPLPNGNISFFFNFGPSTNEPARDKNRAFQFIKPNQNSRESVGIDPSGNFTRWAKKEGTVVSKSSGFLYRPDNIPDGISTVLLSGPGYSAKNGNKGFYGSLRIAIGGREVRAVTSTKLVQGEYLKCSIEKFAAHLKACCINAGAGGLKKCTPR